MEKSIKNTSSKEIKNYYLSLLKILILSITVGIVCGAIGAIFHHGIDIAAELNHESKFMILLMPICGLAITFLYKKLDIFPDPGTNAVLKSSYTGESVSAKMSIGIFVSTILTQLSGGSAGREGAALQLGGSLAGFMGKKFKLDKANMRTIILCGMSALFSALFGTPITAAIFCLEVVCIGVVPYGAFVPALISSFVAKGVSCSMGMIPTSWALPALPSADLTLYIKLIVLAALCAVVSKIFCEIQHSAKHIFDKIPNPYIRILAGSAIIIALTFLLGTNRYNGAGMGAVNEAILEGNSTYLSFLIKAVFTGITIGCGFKGGEIVPCFFAGSTFGCVAGAILGIDPCLAAAVGMICVFCGVVNCPVASIALAVETFGGGILSLIALPIGVSYLLSGSCSLYSTQILPKNKIYVEENK